MMYRFTAYSDTVTSTYIIVELLEGEGVFV